MTEERIKYTIAKKMSLSRKRVDERTRDRYGDEERERCVMENTQEILSKLE